jgi:prophage DNA circulation protein
MASKDQVNNAKELNKLFEDLGKLTQEVEKTFSSISANIGKAAKETGDFSGEFKIAKKDANDIVNQVGKLTKQQKSNLATQRGRNSIAKQYNDFLRSTQKLENTILYLQNLQRNATGEEAELLKKVVNELSNGLEPSLEK